MARENIDIVLSWIGISEGGYVNHPRDPGGATNKGIIQRTYDSWRDYKNLPRRSVLHITDEEVREILINQYLEPIKFNDLPSGLDYAVADYSVNSGPSRAIKDLQKTLGSMGSPVKIDGQIGYETLKAIKEVKLTKLIIEYCVRRMAFLKSLKIFDTFGVGWTRRVIGEMDGVQDYDTGVIDRAYKMSLGLDTSKPKPAPGKAEESNYIILVGLVGAILLFIYHKVKRFWRKDAQQ